ncbi:MAG: hypothetical protein R3B41_00165 [Candidatus Doudnabacteria bacterium]
MTETNFGYAEQTLPAQRAYKKLANYLWMTAGLLFILSLVAVYFKISGSGEVVALRYNIIVGVSKVGDKSLLYRLPATSLMLSVVNFLLSRFNKTEQKILYLLSAMVTVAINLFMLLAIIFLFRVN